MDRGGGRGGRSVTNVVLLPSLRTGLRKQQLQDYYDRLLAANCNLSNSHNIQRDFLKT